MSTKLGEIKGRCIWGYEKYKPIYSTAIISAIRFCGPVELGAMVQLTIERNDQGYIMLTKEEVKKLRKLLKKAYENL